MRRTTPPMWIQFRNAREHQQSTTLPTLQKKVQNPHNCRININNQPRYWHSKGSLRRKPGNLPSPSQTTMDISSFTTRKTSRPEVTSMKSIEQWSKKKVQQRERKPGNKYRALISFQSQIPDMIDSCFRNQLHIPLNQGHQNSFVTSIDVMTKTTNHRFYF